MNLKLPDKMYMTTKYVVTIALPAIATFYAGLATLWGFGKTTEVVGTITLVNTLLGALVALGTAQHNRETRQVELEEH